MGVEIKQLLERDHDVAMAATEIRGLTFGKLDQLSTSSTSGKDVQVPAGTSDDSHLVPRYQIEHLVPAEPLVQIKSGLFPNCLTWVIRISL